jgi:4-hydroxybenzoate polyprenyltransferase
MGVEKVPVNYAWFMLAVCVVASVAVMYFTDFLAWGIQKLRTRREKAVAE